MTAPIDTSRLRLIACLALVLAPHVTNVPPWVTLFAAGVLVWQALGAWRGWPATSSVVRLLLTGVGFVGVYASFGRVSGQEAGVSLLVVMAALKLSETGHHRDRMVLLGLCYFVLITHFLFSQAIMMALYLAVTAWVITATFVDTNHPQATLPWRTAWRDAGVLLLQALPIAALLFVLFPRIPGPLWGLPSDAGASARSGLSDRMEPGQIAQLALSDEVAFRVNFDGAAPPPSRLYWRGPVFWAFDGRRWSPGQPPMDGSPPMQAPRQDTAITYEITLEPHREYWLLALDAPFSGPSDAVFGPAGAMFSKDAVKERRLYRVRSHLNYRMQPNASESVLGYARQLPANVANPRARALAREWRQSLSPPEIVDAALRRFRQQPFHYTLQPPPLTGRDHIDRFLFETQRGFCEHYAGAFTFLMRAADIPARVVTGYQGGETNGLGGYLIVRSADAHAWSEVWLSGRGWVRVDPTTAVAPERIERGVASLGGDEPVPYMARGAGDLLYKLRLGWDWVNAGWNRWFLAYGPDLQQSFLARLGLPNMRAMLVALTAGVTLFLLALGGWLLWQARAERGADPVQRIWLRLCRRLERQGIHREGDEGPLDFADRVARERPALGALMVAVAQRYVALRYAPGPHDPTQRRDFSRLARRTARMAR